MTSATCSASMSSTCTRCCGTRIRTRTSTRARRASGSASISSGTTGRISSRTASTATGTSRRTTTGTHTDRPATPRQRSTRRKTRGGPLVRRPSDQYINAGFGSDSRKKFSFELWGDHDTEDESSNSGSVGLYTNYRPTTAIRLSVSPTFSRLHATTQYVTTITDPGAAATYGKRYIFATLDQRTLDIGTRVEWTATSRLSFQLYMQPFIASGGYQEYKQLATPRSSDYEPLSATAITYDRINNSYRLSGAQTFGNPDFNLRSVRGNAVVRWEFRPRSAL